MPTICHAGPDAATSYRETQDALLIKMQAPLVSFDETGAIMFDAWARPRTRTPSRGAVELARETVVGMGEVYLRNVGPQQLGVALGKMRRPEIASLLINRTALSRWFPYLPMTRGVLLSGSTGDFPDLFADTLNKAVLSHYAMARRTWRAWASRGAVDDFKQADRVRIEDAPGLEQLLPGQSIEFGTLPDNPRETFALATYARGLRYTRQALINDDTEGLKAIAMILSQGAYRLEDTLAYGVLTGNANMADGNALFSAAHGNTTTGTLDNTTLGTASAMLAKRTNTNGDLLDLSPGILVVPSGLKATAEALLDSSANAARHESEPRITTVSSPDLDANSTTEWYLGTDPARMAPVEMSFLRGKVEPHVDQASKFDNDGVLFKVRHDVAASAIDYRCMIRSNGI